MPKSGEKFVCLNHPDVELMILNEKNPKMFHAIRLATFASRNRIQMESKSTLLNILACPECGYAELYLTEAELSLLRSLKSD
ncbi:MAG: hypothetical protein N2317_00900 [Syntrophales bacterium]|nr:hypothetical protein [Syntrophales bacterium]